MTKLGKKARKFAKKHLQSVLKKRRKQKTMFKRKTPRDKGNAAEDQAGSKKDLPIGRTEDVVGDTSLDPIFSDNDSDSREYASSDSDGFLSEDSSCVYDAASESENESDQNGGSALLGQNREIHLELAKQKKKLDSLKEKDPEFSKFLESHDNLEQHRSEESDSEEEAETSKQHMLEANHGSSNLKNGKVLTSSTIDSWCQLVIEEQNLSVLPNLLNAYRSVCHYGSDDGLDAMSHWRIHNSKTFCKILKFMLHEADNIFRTLIGVSSSSCKKEAILELKNTPKWKKSKPLIKSYLSSTMFLLNQVTDSEILVFALTQLRASTIFFAAFPSLLRRLIKVTVHLWATGGGAVSSSSFLIIRDVALLLSSNCLDTCLIKTYKAFIACSKFVEPTNIVHIRFLVDCLVELYSLDVQKSFSKALASIQQLAKILQQGLKTKKKEALKKIPNWQYTNCMDVWVKFVSANIRDHDLQSLLYLMIQVISGVAHLFHGPRYLPLRIKCIQMLNQLSSSCRVFIPITSLVLDSLEYIGSGKPDAKLGNPFDISSTIKVPKQWLKSQCFQEECVLSAIELLSGHFAQWSYHISFPELATIPLIRLKKFHEKLTAESLRRPVKRMIDQVEQNVEFVNNKRDEVAFSPKDQESVESFQPNTCNGNAPFTQYYTDIIKRSLSRKEVTKSELAQKKRRKQKAKIHDKSPGENINVEKESANENVSTINGGRDGRKRKKQRT
ncbi:Nucleolar complex protein 2 [Macleaya cordata]|uniref:Nucleolar complex protein 2 n=1 Tax=Macleaya cordata TaxID=56857 RepID=A0A200QA71_MACCD|nr:Nucleolar complex protein 2 [Macleaya cordata]